MAPTGCQAGANKITKFYWSRISYTGLYLRFISWHFTGFMLALLAGPSCRLGTRVTLTVTLLLKEFGIKKKYACRCKNLAIISWAELYFMHRRYNKCAC